MRRRAVLPVLLLGLPLALAGCGDEASSGDAKLEVVKHADLLERLQKQRGKVVVLDLWASWCGPCRQSFPHLVEMHHKYADRGLVCVSASIDEVGDKEKALKFLQSQNATFANYLIEDGDVAMRYFGVNGIPSVFVYDRDGQMAGPFHEYDTVEKAVKSLLKQ